MSETKSNYLQTFDSNSINWEPDWDVNMMYLRAEEHYFNDLLRRRGYVFLRDIYEQIGLPVTKESLHVGWHYDPDDLSESEHVDFGLPDKDDGDSPNVLLSFNVGGDITNLFED
jgi:hypothetical protein